jgi:hypothetical protein
VDGDARDRLNLRDRLRRVFGRHLLRLRTCSRSLPSSPSSLPPSGSRSRKSVSRAGLRRLPFVPSVVSVISQPGVERRRAR